MKNRIINMTFAALAATLTISSCAEWIDIPVEATVPAETLDYTDASGIQEVVNGAYRIFNTYGVAEWELVMITAMRGDDFDKGTNPTDQATFTEFNNFNYANASSFWALGNAWSSHYSGIGYFNEAIDALKKYGENGASAATVKDAIAQVTVLRDYFYFRLARLFGDIPVYFSNSERSGIKKTKHDKVIKILIDDLAAVADDLADCKPNQATFKGACTRYSAYAVLAKLAAEILDYETVLTYTNKIITKYGQGALYADYHYLFTSNGNLCDENLLESQISSKASPASPWTGYKDFQGPGTTITAKVPVNGSNTLGGGWSFFYPTDKIVNLMKSRGETVRHETAVIYGDADTWYGDHVGHNDYSNRWNGKIYNPSGLCHEASWGDGVNVRVIRYADILLLNAEASVKTGKSGDTYYNWVRTRAKMPTKTGVTFEEIMEERFVELCFENGERYYDLARTGLAAKELASYGYSEDKRYYPIPQTVLDATATMKEPAE